MANVAILGLGAMGQRMAMNVLKAGHRVTVWNRSPQAKETLVAVGATAAASPRSAATGADLVISMVRDDQASRQIWLDPDTGALQAMTINAIAVECSTVSCAWISELGAQANARGVSLLDAPVSGSRPQAQAGQLVFLVGGEPQAVASCRDILLSMGSALEHVGPLGTGTLVKLATNALLGVQVTALAELLGMLSAHGVDLGKAAAAIGGTTVASAAMQRSTSLMLADDVTPQFPVSLIDKDFGYIVEAAGGETAAPTIAAAGRVYANAQAEGLGALNMTAVARLFSLA